MAEPGVMPITKRLRRAKKNASILPFTTQLDSDQRTPRRPARRPRPRRTLLPPHPAGRRRFRYAQAYFSWPSWLKPRPDMLPQLSLMSPVVRQQLPPTSAPTSRRRPCLLAEGCTRCRGRTCRGRPAFSAYGALRSLLWQEAPVVFQVIDAPLAVGLGVLVLVAETALVAGAGLGTGRRVDAELETLA